MNSETFTIDEQDLVDFADGQLDPLRQALVEAHIANSPEAALKVVAYREQRQQLHELFDPLLAAPIPKHLLPNDLLAESASPSLPKPSPNARIWRYAAMLALFATGISFGWLAHQKIPSLPISGVARPAHVLFSQASSAHAVYAPEILHPVEVSALDEKHLANWLSDRMGNKIRIPDLHRQGFKLVGGRLLPANPGSIAVQLMYENENKLRLTFYLRKMEKKDPNTSIRYGTTKGISVTYWIDHDWGYALSGRFEEDVMIKLSESVYQQYHL